MKILGIDGQGGGLGKAIMEKLRLALPDETIIAVGTNSAATSSMLKGGATAGATGENALKMCIRDRAWVWCFRISICSPISP